jgi:hypothetical protein
MTMRALAVAITLLLPAAPLTAQTAPAGGEEQAVLAVVRRLFDAMRSGDSAAVRAVFQPGAQLVSVAVRNGAPALQVDSVTSFARAVGTPHAQVWDERIWNEKAFVDGNLAVVWTDYAFYLGDKFSHCGVDAFQLFRGADGWKIFSLADTRRREGCQEPPKSR